MPCRARAYLPLLLCLWLAGCAAAIVGGGAHGGYESSPAARGDAEISAAVTRSLVKDRTVNALDISVKSYRGTVSLSGSVRSAAEARRAVRLAESVNGVDRVISDLRVAVP